MTIAVGRRQPNPTAIRGVVYDHDRSAVVLLPQVAESQPMSERPADYPPTDTSPSDIAERAVLGAILHDAGLIAVASDLIGPEDF